MAGKFKRYRHDDAFGMMVDKAGQWVSFQETVDKIRSLKHRIRSLESQLASKSVRYVDALMQLRILWRWEEQWRYRTTWLRRVFSWLVWLQAVQFLYFWYGA